MACLACEIACSEAFYKRYDPALSCIHIAAKGDEAKPQVCIQCGKCARECPSDAITLNETTGVYMLSKAKCVGCGHCADICPFGVIPYDAATEKASKCIACGICAKACPQGVLSVNS
jgi:Fe-S-cluster-containing hydrogenase component 2